MKRLEVKKTDHGRRQEFIKKVIEVFVLLSDKPLGLLKS